MKTKSYLIKNERKINKLPYKEWLFENYKNMYATNPKQEAKELLIEYFILLGGKLYENEKVYLNSTIWNEAKQCALLSVKKILIVLEEELLELYDKARTCDVNKKLQERYLEIKKELEQM